MNRIGTLLGQIKAAEKGTSVYVEVTIHPGSSVDQGALASFSVCGKLGIGDTISRQSIDVFIAA